MSVRSLNSARSGGVFLAITLIVIQMTVLFVVGAAYAKPPHYKIESVGKYGDRLKALPADIIPGDETETVDRRIHKDVVRLSRRFKQIATDCYSPMDSGDHAPNGDHPKGVGCDFVPNNRKGGTWGDTLKFAVYMGWQSVGFRGCETGDMGCATRLASISVPARWIGYNGTKCHGDPAHIFGGCGAHLHVSFKSSPTPPGGWPHRVTRFANPGSGSDKNEEPPVLIEPAEPSEGTSSDLDQYPIEIPQYVDVSAIAPADELTDSPSSLSNGKSVSRPAASAEKANNIRAKTVNLPQLEAIVSSINETVKSAPVAESVLGVVAPADEVDLQAVVLEAMNEQSTEDVEDNTSSSADPNGFTATELAAVAPADELVDEGALDGSVSPGSVLAVEKPKRTRRIGPRFGRYRVGDQYWYRANYRHVRWANRLPASARRGAAAVAWKVNAAAKKYHIEPELLAALIYHESGFQRKIVSSANAQGYTQLMPATAASMGVTDRTNARQNIFGGARYLRLLLNRFRGNMPLSLKGYNAGPNAPWNAVAGYESRIMNLRDHLRRTR